MNVWKGLIYYSSLSSVCVRVCSCASLQGLFVHSIGTKTQMDCEFCVYKSLHCCFASLFLLRTAMGVKTQYRVWHPDASWISGQRLSVHRDEEGGSVPRLKACLFDIAFPHHLTALSVFSCKASNTVIPSVQTLRLYSRVYVCFHTCTPITKLVRPMKC